VPAGNNLRFQCFRNQHYRDRHGNPAAGKVVGTHWVNPPHIMQLVEIVQGDTTTNETVATVRAFLTRIGKVPIVCKDTISYLNNYMQGAIGRAAMELWQKGVASRRTSTERSTPGSVPAAHRGPPGVFRYG